MFSELFVLLIILSYRKICCLGIQMNEEIKKIVYFVVIVTCKEMVDFKEYCIFCYRSHMQRNGRF